jgi:hypothetical protein
MSYEKEKHGAGAADSLPVGKSCSQCGSVLPSTNGSFLASAEEDEDEDEDEDGEDGNGNGDLR